MVRRHLANEPGVVAERLRGGLAFLCRGGFGRDDAPPALFAVALPSGVLLRLPEDSRARLLQAGVGTFNAALPDWMQDVEVGGVRLGPMATGPPEEWVWLPLPDAEASHAARGLVQTWDGLMGIERFGAHADPDDHEQEPYGRDGAACCRVPGTYTSRRGAVPGAETAAAPEPAPAREREPVLASAPYRRSELDRRAGAGGLAP